MLLNTVETSEGLATSATKFSRSCLVGAVTVNQYKMGVFRGKISFVTPVRLRPSSSEREAVLEDGLWCK